MRCEAGVVRGAAAGRAVRRGAVAALAVALLGACSGADEPGAGATPGSTASSPEATPGASPDPTATATASGEATTSTATPSGTTTAGGLVEGFPTDVVPVVDGLQVQASAVVPQEGLRQVSLTGVADAPPEQLVQAYRDGLLAQGFVEFPVAPVEGVVQASFSRAEGQEVLTVVVRQVDGRSSLSVGGSLLP